MLRNGMLIGIAALAATSAIPACAQHMDPGEKALAASLKGRVAGKPVKCLLQRNIRAVEIIDRTAIIYEMQDGTRYVNRPRLGAESLDRMSILVSDTHTGELCNVDVVKLVDQGTRLPRGFVNLDKFIPYPKPKHRR